MDWWEWTWGMKHGERLDGVESASNIPGYGVVVKPFRRACPANLFAELSP